MMTYILHVRTTNPAHVINSIPRLPGQTVQQVSHRTVEVDLGISKALTPEQVDWLALPKRETRVVSFTLKTGNTLQPENIQEWARQEFARSKNVTID